MNKKEALEWLAAQERAVLAARNVVLAIPDAHDAPDDAEFGQDYYISLSCSNGININVYDSELYPKLRKALGGKRDKINLYGTPGVSRTFETPSTSGYNTPKVRLYDALATCEQVQVGTRFVEAQPAVEAHEEPVYEWRCS